MSLWRREASARLPELQHIIASRIVESPMMLWIELNQEFENLSKLDPQPLDLLARIWRYSDWCLKHGSAEVGTGAALAFCEHLMDSLERISVLPKIMKKSDFPAIRGLLEYHNSSSEVDACLNSLWK